jgi:hypothetical protein
MLINLDCLEIVMLAFLLPLKRRGFLPEAG